jgi:hypothetical protein
MKVYTRVVMDMTRDDMPVIESESYEYDGPVALCWGVGSGEGDDAGPSGPSGPGGSGPGGPGGTGSGGVGGLDGNQGWGGYGDPDSPGQGSGYGQAGPSRGGGGANWGDSPHGNPHGTIGPSMDAYGGYSMGLSSNDPHRGLDSLPDEFSRITDIAQRQNIRALPEHFGILDKLGALFGTLWDSGGIGMAGGLFSANPMSFGYNAYKGARYAHEEDAVRGMMGLASVGPPDFDMADQDTGLGGDMMAQAVPQDQKKPIGRPENMEDILEGTREALQQYDPQEVMRAMPTFRQLSAVMSTSKNLTAGVQEVLRRGGVFQ